MAAPLAGRSILLRSISRTKLANSRPQAAAMATTMICSPPSSHSIRLNSVFRRSRISPARSPASRFVRRELSSILPDHSAIASACLVSKLPSDANTSSEGRFANYLSPI